MKHYWIQRFFKKTVLFILFQPILILILHGCSSNSIINSKISITPEEQRRLVGAVNRKSNHTLYASDLSHVTHPSEKELFRESNLVSSEYFKSNYEILVQWYENKLSKSELRRLTNNCAALVGRFSESFPLTETSLPCAGWWLERRANILSQMKSFSEIPANKKNSTVSKILSSKNSIKFTAYRNMGFFDATYNIDQLNFKQLNRLSRQTIVNKKNCHYKNMYAALMFKLSDSLPQKQFYQNIQGIYRRASTCYTQTDVFLERLNLRLGVLNIIHGNYQLASRILKKNLSISEADEGSRSLFWLGIVEQKKNHSNKKFDNRYWKQMIRENPLGLFSIIANEKMNQDPLDAFVPDHSIIVQNRVFGGWNENNLQAFLGDLFYKKHETQALRKLYRNVVNNAWLVDPDLHLYWAISNHLAGNDRFTILMMSKYFESQKEPKLSARLLELNFPTTYSNEILNTSEKIDPLLVLALIRQESAFDARAISSANARGLMQILPSTARMLKKGVKAETLYEPHTNIKLGVMYLERLFKKYHGRTEYVLAAYNAGPMRADTWSRRISHKTPLLFIEYIPFYETRKYVSIIMRNYYWYNRLMRDQKNDQLAKLYRKKNLDAIWKPTNILAMIDE